MFISFLKIYQNIDFNKVILLNIRHMKDHEGFLNHSHQFTNLKGIFHSVRCNVHFENQSTSM